MEFNTCNRPHFGIRGLIKELAGNGIYRTDVGALGGLSITQHLEIVLEDVNDFIGLELALNPRRDSINEGV